MLSFVDPTTLLPFPHISFGEHRCFAVEMGQAFAMMATTGLSHDIFVAPCEVGCEWDTDVTIGLAFARGEVSLEQLLAEVDR